MWRELLTRLKPSQGALAQLAVPIITVILGVLFIGEDIKNSHLLGGALTLLGIRLNNK
jgi:drug/metabolite transporter (DMT)-like permease